MFRWWMVVEQGSGYRLRVRGGDVGVCRCRMSFGVWLQV